MALIQALFSLLSRSLGKILNAIFGWAVVALFGQTSPTQKTLLSGLVALAAFWPVLLVGIAVPKVAALVLAFVPPSAQGPSWIMRIIWLALAIAVPTVVGLVVAAKAPPHSPPEPVIKRVLRGFPITMGLGLAFLLTFVSVPFMRIAAILKRQKDEHVPVLTSAEAYDDVAARIDRILQVQKLDADRARAPWWLVGPTRVLLKLGGKAFRGFAADQLAYWRGPRMEIALYPSDLLLRGARKETAFAHGVITEDLARSQALQTFEPAAQEIERQVRRVWQVLDENPAAHQNSAGLTGRLREITDQLAKTDVPYEEWSILYRQCAQLDRALHGQAQLLAKEGDEAMATTGSSKTDRTEAMGENENRSSAREHGRAAPATAIEAPNVTAARREVRAASTLSAPQLVSETAREAVNLVKTEVALAKAELREDLQSEITAAKGLSVAAVCGIAVFNMLLVTAALALARVMADWGASLLVAGVVAVAGTIAGALGWKHVRTPLRRTRKSLEEDVRWAKERTA